VYVQITADVEFSYTGNFRMVIDVGLLGQSTKLDFYDLRLSGEARVQIEPSDLSPEVAAAQPNFKPFSTAKLSFMKKPYVDISFSLGETDGKKMKSEARGFEANLGETVKQMIATKALYPKCIQINLDKSSSTGESYSIANPIGVLRVQVLGGTDLEIGDIHTSDPFVEVRYADEIEKTAVIFKTLNPVWNNECFEFLIFNECMTGVELIVYDYDLGSSPDFLGSAKFDFSLKHSGEVEELSPTTA
jgi:Ca2+-dependent lipid-binding protein